MKSKIFCVAYDENHDSTNFILKWFYSKEEAEEFKNKCIKKQYISYILREIKIR